MLEKTSGDADVQTAVQPLPKPNSGVTYLSIPRLVTVLESFWLFKPTDEAKTLLKPFKGICLSSGVPKDDSQGAVLFIHVSE